MKLFAAIVAFTLLCCVHQSLEMRGYVKMLKIVAKQTGTRCKNLFVKLTPVTRYDTTLTVTCDELTRPIDKGFVNFRAFAKTATMQNFRQIVNLKNLEPCKIMEDRKKFPVLNSIFDGAMKLYPQYVHPCPFLEVKVYNISLSFMQNPTQNMMADFNRLNFHMPNGIYRLEGEGWDDTGDAWNASLWIESKYRARITQDKLNDM